MLISTDFLLGDCSLCDVDASFLSLPIPSLWSATFASDKKAKEDQESINMNSSIDSDEAPLSLNIHIQILQTDLHTFP